MTLANYWFDPHSGYYLGAVSGYIHMRSQDQLLHDDHRSGPASGSIASATWHSMLADNRESTYQIIQTIATSRASTASGFSAKGA
jgi:hypothetical protein